MKQLILCLLLAVPGVSIAREIGGVEMPETTEFAGQTLQLNGVALRKKFFIKVYACGLYVPKKSSDGTAIASADEPMMIRMAFIYDGVSADKLIDAWNDGFEAATHGNTAPIQAEIDSFNAMFTEEAKEGDVYLFQYEPGEGVTFVLNGVAQGSVQGLAFKEALFGIWVGEKLADGNLKDMKKGLLKN